MSSTLMPHAVCWNQDPALIWTMASTNAVTFFSYLVICATLLYLSRKTGQVLGRDWFYLLVGFGVFIAACGTTHLMEVVTTWIPAFWVDAWANIITAIFSAYVAIQFARQAPQLGFGINDYASRLSTAETEKARAEESLVAARKLEEWNRMSAVVTHEVANPLSAIQNLLFLIQLSPGLSPETATMVQQTVDEVKRIETITRSTLGFFRSSSEPERVDLVESVEAVRFLLGPVLRQRGIELEISHSGNCSVHAFAVETRQVLLNLIRNACDATTGSGAKVMVSITGRADDVEVVVADQGSGIDPEILPKLFHFGATTKGARGNGMGLWLVKQLVTRHGGAIDVDSKPGEGSRFTIVWPRRIPETAAPPHQTLAQAER